MMGVAIIEHVSSSFVSMDNCEDESAWFRGCEILQRGKQVSPGLLALRNESHRKLQ